MRITVCKRFKTLQNPTLKLNELNTIKRKCFDINLDKLDTVKKGLRRQKIHAIKKRIAQIAHYKKGNVAVS